MDHKNCISSTYYNKPIIIYFFLFKFFKNRCFHHSLISTTVGFCSWVRQKQRKQSEWSHSDLESCFPCSILDWSGHIAHGGTVLLLQGGHPHCWAPHNTILLLLIYVVFNLSVSPQVFLTLKVSSWKPPSIEIDSTFKVSRLHNRSIRAILAPTACLCLVNKVLHVLAPPPLNDFIKQKSSRSSSRVTRATVRGDCDEGFSHKVFRLTSTFWNSVPI